MANIDSDLRRAQQGKLYDLQSHDSEVVYSKPIDLSQRYCDERLRAPNVTFENKEKGHVWWKHPDDREWLSRNQELVLKAIIDPLYVDVVPRTGKRNIHNIALVIYIGEKDYPYLNVVLNFQAGRAKILTMYRAGSRFVFDGDQLRSRWNKAK